jgi:hypothetical protein
VLLALLCPPSPQRMYLRSCPPAALHAVLLRQVGFSASSFTSLRYMHCVDGCELKGLFSEARLKRNVFFDERLLARKIALPVRFAEVKEEAAKSTNRRKTTLNAAGGHVAKRTGSAIPPPQHQRRTQKKLQPIQIAKHLRCTRSHSRALFRAHPLQIFHHECSTRIASKLFLMRIQEIPIQSRHRTGIFA